MENQLSINSAKKLIGKTIEWHAPAYKHNQDYTGVAKILSVDENNNRPLTVEAIKGDDLRFAFNEWADSTMLDFPLCYSDGGRYVTFKTIKND